MLCAVPQVSVFDRFNKVFDFSFSQIVLLLRVLIYSAHSLVLFLQGCSIKTVRYICMGEVGLYGKHM
jgi:hypothetical protein